MKCSRLYLLVILFFNCCSFSSAQQWIVYRDTNSALPTNWLTEIKIDKFDNKWMLAYNTNDLIKFDGNIWTIYNHSNSGLPDTNLLAIAIDKNDNKWIATKNGLVKFDNSNWIVYNTSNSCLPINQFKDCDVDSSNNVWLATDSGIVKFDMSFNCSVYSTSNGSLQGSNQVREIKVDSRNWIWSTNPSPGGLFLNAFNGSIWQNFTSLNYGSNVFPTNLFCDSSGNIWASAGNGILKFDGTNFSVPYDTSISFFFNGIVPVYSTSNFIAAFSNTTVSLDYYDGVSWSYFNIGNSPLHGAIFNFASDQYNNLWMVGEYGLYEFNQNGIVTTFNRKETFKISTNCYPNPTSDIFFICTMSNKIFPVKMIIYDTYGREINCPYESEFKQSNEKIFKVDLRGFNTGIYVYKLFSDNFSKTGKIIFIK